MTLFLGVLLSAALGGFVQSVTGFGAAVVMMTIFPRLFGMALAPSVSTGICLGLTVALAWQFRRYARRELILLPTILYTVSSVLVIRLIGSMDLRLLTVAFGGVLILLGGWLLFFAGSRTFRVTLGLTVVCSLAAGVCGGLFSIAGPIMAIYFLAATDSREAYLGNMQTHFLFNNCISAAARAASGLFPLSLVPMTLLGVAGVVCGQKLGLAVGKKLNAEQMKKLVYLYVMVSGAVTVVRNL